MRSLVLVLLVLVACGHSKPAPIAPVAPPRNEAVHYALTNFPTAGCVAVRTGDPKEADTALCEAASGRVWLACWSGFGAGSECKMIANFIPQQAPQPEPKVDEKKDEAKPDAKAPDAKPDPKPADKKPTPAKGEPPKKVEPKK